MRVTFVEPVEPLKPGHPCHRCEFGQRHQPGELVFNHPEAGGGYTKEHGWSGNIAEDRRVSGVEPLVVGKQV